MEKNKNKDKELILLSKRTKMGLNCPPLGIEKKCCAKTAFEPFFDSFKI